LTAHLSRFTASIPKPTGSVFSTAVGFGKTKDCAPGNFDSTLGIVAGIEFAFGERRLVGEGDRLFGERGESSRRGVWPPIVFFILGTVVEELRIVGSVGLPDRSGISVAVGAGIEICSIVSLEFIAAGDIDI